MKLRQAEQMPERRGKNGKFTADAVLALVAVGLDVALFSQMTEDESRTSWVTVSYSPAIVILASLPAVPILCIRRRWPLGVTITLSVHAALLTIILGTRPLLTLAIALFATSALRPLRSGLIGLVAALVAHALAVAYETYSFLRPSDRILGSSLIAIVFVVCELIAWGLGRRAATASLRERGLEEMRDVMAVVAMERREVAQVSDPSERLRVFVNYRTEDTAHAAGRLGEELIEKFGADRVFIDVDSLKAGADFRVDIASAIARTAVMLVVIGRKWVSRDGRRRLNDPEDVLRIEIEQALLMGVRIVPVLVDGASMPSEVELPPGLQPLTRRNAMTLSARTFRRDVNEVVAAVAGSIGDGVGR